MPAKKRALVSVSDKSGVVEFAKELTVLGYEVVSTGGRQKLSGRPVLKLHMLVTLPDSLKYWTAESKRCIPRFTGVFLPGELRSILGSWRKTVLLLLILWR